MSETTNIAVNETIAELVEASEGSSLAIIEGYVSSAEGSTIKIHPNLDPNVSINISRKDIIHSIASEDLYGKRNQLIVRADAEITVFTRDKFRAGDMVNDATSTNGVGIPFIDIGKIVSGAKKVLALIDQLNTCLTVQKSKEDLEDFLEKYGDKISQEDREKFENTLLDWTGYLQQNCQF